MNSGLLAYLVAFGGGVISFLSPCVLPLVPAYLSVVTGLEVAEVQNASRAHLVRIARDTALFIAGFGTVFVTLGLSATLLGRALFAEHILLTRISGVVLIGMAIFLVFAPKLKSPLLQGERRFHVDAQRFGPLAAPVAGAAFGFGWTPCIGPILASVLAVAGASADPWRGATLLGTYTLGLGLCFLAAGLLAGRLTMTLAWVKRHFRLITIASSLIMAGFGVLLVFNSMALLTLVLEAGLRSVGLGRLIYIG